MIETLLKHNPKAIAASTLLRQACGRLGKTAQTPTDNVKASCAIRGKITLRGSSLRAAHIATAYRSSTSNKYVRKNSRRHARHAQ